MNDFVQGGVRLDWRERRLVCGCGGGRHERDLFFRVLFFKELDIFWFCFLDGWSTVRFSEGRGGQNLIKAVQRIGNPIIQGFG